MNVVSMVLIRNKINLPLDILIFINEWIKCEKLTNSNIKKAVNLWVTNNKECLFKYGHISHWNTSNITNMMALFYFIKNFNEDISDWNVSNVTNMSFMFCDASSFNGNISDS